MNFSVLKNWDALHPIVIHFPIGLLFLAPLFIFLGLFFKDYRRQFLVSALIIIFLGTLSLFFAVSTGHSAKKVADRTVEIDKVIHEHEELAETSRNLFSILTIVFSLIVFYPNIFKKELSLKKENLIVIIFVILYAFSLIFLLNGAHKGGLLVHHYGVKASW